MNLRLLVISSVLVIIGIKIMMCSIQAGYICTYENDHTGLVTSIELEECPVVIEIDDGDRLVLIKKERA